jgi:hypothetical protein
MSEEMNRRKGQYIKGVALIKRSLDCARDDNGRGGMLSTLVGEYPPLFDRTKIRFS